MRASRLARFLWLLLVLALAGDAAGETVLLPRESEWRFEATGTDLGTAWRDTSHNDTVWTSGPGILGYGETYITTPVPFGPDSGAKYPTTYFRTTFIHTGPLPDALEARVNFDDAFVLYLNGQEVARNNITGTVTYGAWSDGNHEGGAYTAFDLTAWAGLLVAGTNHLAVEVHQRSGSSSDMVMDLELAVPDPPPELSRGPYLQVARTDGITIRWRTLNPSDSRVRLGTQSGVLTLTVDDALVTTEHEVVVSGLSPYTAYFYSIGSTATELASEPDFRFRTHPLPGTATPFRAWVIGDAGTANVLAESVRDGYLLDTAGAETQLWLMLGDNAYSTGTDAEYQAAVFDMYPGMLRTTPVWPTRGNHDDLHSGPDNDYYDIFTLPTGAEAGGLGSGTEAYYSFDYANVHFICLDSDGSDRTPGGAMLQWLSSDLALTTREWIVAFWHHPPYSKGSHDSDIPGESGGLLEDMRENALPILEAGGVDLVLGGHSHSYERSFLIDGHYDVSTTFHDSMKVDGGMGDPLVDGAYYKPPLGGAHQGTVYVVAGSSGRVGGGTLDHPVMAVSLAQLGSLVLEVDGNRLEARFLDPGGNTDDGFTMIKGIATGFPPDLPRNGLRLSNSPNPFAVTTRLAFSLPAPGETRLTLVDVRGRRVRRLVDAWLPAGDHQAPWDGRDEYGRPVAAGLYFSVLEHGGDRRVRKILLRP